MWKARLLYALGEPVLLSSRRVWSSARREEQEKPTMTEVTRPFLPKGPEVGFMSPRLNVEDNTTPRATDKAWELAFKINVAITLVTALFLGRTGADSLHVGDMYTEGEGRRLQGAAIVLFSPALFVAGVVGLGWAFGWGVLHLVMNFSKDILQVSILILAGVWGVFAVSALAAERWLTWIFPAIMCAWCVHFYAMRQSRILFCSANLKVAAIAVKSMPSTIHVALLMSGVQALWVLTSAMAAAGSIAYFGSHRSLACFWLVSLTWGSFVIQNVVSATVIGSVASWWYSDQDASPVRGAMYRATHGSFGSLCKAAAVTTVVGLLVLVMRRLNKLGRFGNYLLTLLRRVVNYFLAYAICFVAIYGLSFSEAGERVSELFRRRGVTTIANSRVVDVGLTAVILGASVCYVAAAYLLVVVVAGAVLRSSVLFGGMFGIVFYGYFLVTLVVATMLEVLRSSFQAVFVCFVQDPEALATNHGRQLFDDMSKAWDEMKAECPSGTVGDVGHGGEVGIQRN